MKTQKIDRRKILLFLPLVIVLFSALGFYAMGGGTDKVSARNAPVSGINTSLPDARLKSDQPLEKMDIYKMAGSDSSESGGIETIIGKIGYTPADDAQTRKIKERLAEIDKEINSPVTARGIEVTSRNSSPENADLSKDVAKLESLMKNMQSGQEDDPEMRQLHSLMDKIMAVQNPELVRRGDDKTSGSETDSVFRAIPAELARDQKVIQGAVVELKLMDTVSINGQLIPKHHSLFGLAQFSNQRLNILIKNIRLGTSVIPVNLTVFDRRDAMQGINAPDALLGDAITRGSSDAISGLGLTGYDITSQIAGAGIDAAKSLFNKKVKRVKQSLKAGYPLLIRDNSRKNK